MSVTLADDLYSTLPALPPGMPRLVSVAFAQRALSLSRPSVYALMARGDLKTLRVGDRRLIPLSSLQRFIEHGASNRAALRATSLADVPLAISEQRRAAGSIGSAKRWGRELKVQPKKHPKRQPDSAMRRAAERGQT